MTKRTIFTAAAPVLVFTTVAFSTIKRNVDVEASTIEWTGKKITGSSHHGTIQLKEGYLNLTENGTLTGGEFIMDMNTINVTDLSGENKVKLEGHLNNDDFFGVDKYSTSKFVITKTTKKTNNVYTVTGNLTIKGKTEPVTFDMTVNDDTASAKINVDRTKYGIRYGSGSFFSNLGDNTINNNFVLDVTLKF